MGMRVVSPQLNLHTFSFIATDDPSVNEERWADEIINASQAKAFKTAPDAEMLLKDMQDMVFSQDEPVASTSVYAQFCVFRLAHQQGIKVMLDGQGADEMLAGYPVHKSLRLTSLIRQFKVKEAVHYAKAIAQNTPFFYGREMTMRALGEFLPQKMYVSAYRMSGRDSTQHYLNFDWFNLNGATPVLPYRAPSSKSDSMRFYLIDALQRSSIPTLLHYEDRNSMAFSIESRVPFLTTELAEFLLSLPESYLVSSDGVTKSVFRHAMRSIVPDVILDRKDKIGFAAPENKWLTKVSTWIDELLNDQGTAKIAALNLPTLHRNWQRIKKGERAFDTRVWRWINLITWSKAYQVTY
jgi:asparagine synthase (glutamine-hydrolysing)